MDSARLMALLMQTAGAAGEPGERVGEVLGQCSASLGVLAMLAAVVVIKVGFVAAAVWFGATWPGASNRMVEAYESRAARCVVVGTVNALVGAGLGVLLIATQVLAVLGLLLLACLGAMVLVGYGVAYTSLGRRLVPAAAEEAPLRGIALGGLVAEGAFCVPVLGQFVSFGVLVRGLGAVVLGAVSRRRRQARESRIDGRVMPE
ncbi:MAG: hypothetical protein JXR94_21215 [Candidatus Hydrogenedentes bacterium]|nr:hypothetical protein [Candidatus Hydrogenedentota bacterium]